MNITFDHVTHSYKAGDKLLVSVTQMMQEVGATKPIPENIRQIEVARQIGIQNHAVLADFINNPFVESELYDPFIETLSSFLSSNALGKDMFSAEKIVYDLELGVAGTVDMIGTDNTGKAIVVDHKFTSTHKKQHMWQVALYALIHDKNASEENYGCYIINYNLNRIEIATASDFEIARQIIDCYVSKAPFFAEGSIPEELEDMYEYVCKHIAEMEQQKEYIEYLIQESVGRSSAKGKKLSVAYKAPSESKRLDSEKVAALLTEQFKEDLLKINEFYKVSKVSGSYSFKLNKEKKEK